MAPRATTRPRTEHLIVRCGQCGQWDDHPKLHLGFLGDAGRGVSPGWSKHHDCVDHQVKLDVLAGGHSQHPLITGKIFHACEVDGIKGDALRKLILGLKVRDFGPAQMMAGGMYQSYANILLDASLPGTGTKTIGGSTITAPMKVRYMSANSTDTGAGTEWGTAAGYTAGGVSVGNNWNAAASASKSASATVSVTNSPAQTWAGNDITDSSGTPIPEFWGPLSGGNKTVNAADTASLTALSAGIA